MKNLFTLLTLFLFTTSAFAQQNLRHFCGHDHKIEEMILQNPDYAEAYDGVYKKLKEIGENSSLKGQVLTIPTVIHIVWHTNRPEENLPDSVIFDQMNVLNEAFRFTNPDKVNLRDTFNSIVGDAMIEFELAGIVRKETTSNFGFNNTDNAKKDATGGSDAWDTDHFLNIWVFKLPSLFGGQLLGQAYPPAGLPNWPFPLNLGAPAGLDGAIVDFRVFGSNNSETLGSYDARGRTAVHEVGHYLGLRHIWGDGNCGADDGVEDTPRANDASTAFSNVCNPNRNTCGFDGPNVPDRPNMWENYMDYATESCQVALTQGQITIMRGALEGPRAGLLEPQVNAAINLTTAKGFSIYPNPIYNGIARIQANETPNAITIFDVVGNEVYYNNQVRLGEVISFENFPKGIYLIAADFDEGKATQKIILK